MNLISEIEENRLKELFKSEIEFHFTDFNGFGEYITSVSEHPHKNHFYQLFLYKAGTGKHYIDLNIVNFKPGTLVAIYKGQIQKIESDPETQAFVLSFTEQFLYRYEDDLQWLHHLNLFDILKLKNDVIPKKEDWDNLILFIHQIREEFEADNTNLKEDIIRDLLRVFIHYAERLFDSTQKNISEYDNDYNIYHRFRKILEDDYKSCRSVKEFANQVYVTPKKLNQVILKYGHRNAKRMIEERVIMEIKRLLFYSNRNIKEIAIETGFSDLTNFVKFFKRHTKTTPAKFPKS